MVDLETTEARVIESDSGNQPAADRDFLPKGSSKITEITLGGVRVRAKTDATPALLKQTRELVESLFDDYADKLTNGVSAHQLTILVAFNLAEELLREREKMKFFKRQVSESSERLMNRVEAFLDK